ncbi:hypothetical protein CSP17_003024 [Salmonella enterica subsp. arizonae]|nr:hypothetical protein [Salmonella enterica subsp. arizonae]EDQ0264090.1 hypothetical protein [Salmonella enterica]EDQ9042932.1 hypothetical protein [Salmonella enterica subsp. arizonae serovar [1],13,23:g,z51:-]EDR4454375.1 hypothetical protein [Salmonella enterica subsp. arizonae serovar 13,23:gz51:-]EDU1961686.1 hypothetical protein [Salmonella enterica subsp. arizonae serovar 53:z4,z23:-]EDY0803384.1 hypothetical protein [Salmonella enterica subsp. arizonae serovar 62:z4,z23:-]EEE2581116
MLIKRVCLVNKDKGRSRSLMLCVMMIADNHTNIPNFTDSPSHLYYPYCSKRHLWLP